jgi:hypothetical protein
MFEAGLPDGVYIFKPKIPIWVYIWSALAWKMLVYLTAYWNIARKFGICFGNLVIFIRIFIATAYQNRKIYKNKYFFLFWYAVAIKIWQPRFKTAKVFLIGKVWLYFLAERIP